MAEEPSNRLLSDENMVWLGAPVGGAFMLYGVFGATVWLSTWLAGAAAGGLWPGLGTAFSALWAQLNGERIDHWLLTNTPVDAIVAPMWFWALFALLLVLGVLVGALGVLAVMQAFEPSAKSKTDADKKEQAGKKEQDRDQRKAARSMTEPRWPVPGPWAYPKNPSPGVLLGTVGRKLIVDTATTPVMVSGPTSSGKTRRILAPNLAHWPGPAIGTSVKPDLLQLTVEYRRQLGPVWGFDPAGRYWPALKAMGVTPVVWDPVRLFAQSPDPNDAILFSEFLMSQVSAAQSGSQKIWKSHSVEMMIRMLVLAKELEQPLAEFLRWIVNPQLVIKLAAKPALHARLSNDAHMHLEMLTETVKMDKRIVDSIKTTMLEVATKLRWTAEHPDAELMPMTMTSDGSSGTLYLVADHASMSSHSPIFAAALRHLFHAAEVYSDDAQRLNQMLIKAQAEARENAVTALDVDPATDPLAREPRLVAVPEMEDKSRLRPLFCLDELASLALLNDLPEIISTIRSRAQVISGIQEEAQLVEKWSAHAAKSLKGNHPTEVQLGGSGDVDAMRGRAAMSAIKDATAADMRMIEPGRALVTSGALISFEIDLVDTKKWIDPDREAQLGKEAVNAVWEQLLSDDAAAAPAEPPTAPAPPEDAHEPDAVIDPGPAPQDPNDWGYYEPPPEDDYGHAVPPAPRGDARSLALASVQAEAAKEHAMARIGAAAGALALPGAGTAASPAQHPAAGAHGPLEQSIAPAAAEAEPTAEERLRIGAWLLGSLEGGGSDPANLALVAEMMQLGPDELAARWRQHATPQEAP